MTGAADPETGFPRRMGYNISRDKEILCDRNIAEPDVYNPMKKMPGMVLDALNVGMLMMGRQKGTH